MLTIKKFIGLPALLLGLAGAVTVMGVSSPAFAGAGVGCTALGVVGSYGTAGTTTTDTMGNTGTSSTPGSTTTTTTTTPTPGTTDTMGTTGTPGSTTTTTTTTPGTTDTMGTTGIPGTTDFSVPGGGGFNGFVARMTATDAGTFPVRIYLKYSNNTSDLVLDQPVSLNAGETKSLAFAPRTDAEPFQVSTVVDSQGRAYTVYVDGCFKRPWWLESNQLYFPMYGPGGRYPFARPVTKTWWN